MIFIYFFIAIVVSCCLLRIINQRAYKQQNKKEIKKVSNMFSDLPKETRYEMFKTTYGMLTNELFFLEKNAKEHFTEIDKIKHIMKDIRQECEKLEKDIRCD